MPDLDALKAQLAEALHGNGYMVIPIWPIVLAALGDARQQGRAEGREDAAQALEDQWGHARNSFHDHTARHMLTYQFAASLARGVPVEAEQPEVWVEPEDFQPGGYLYKPAEQETK